MIKFGMWALTVFSLWRVLDAMLGSGITLYALAYGKTDTVTKAAGKGCLKVIGTLVVFGFFLYIGILGITSL